jgi:hypothetical protein
VLITSTAQAINQTKSKDQMKLPVVHHHVQSGSLQLAVTWQDPDTTNTAPSFNPKFSLPFPSASSIDCRLSAA